MAIQGSVLGISKVESLFQSVASKSPKELDLTINSESKKAKKIVQSFVKVKSGNLRKSIANKKIRKAEGLTKVIGINGRKAPYGKKINAKITIVKKGRVIGPYRHGQFIQKSIKPIERSVETAVKRMRLL